jgi:hypothetical protein
MMYYLLDMTNMEDILSLYPSRTAHRNKKFVDATESATALIARPGC